MSKEEYKELRSIIRNIKYLNINQSIVMYKYFFKALLYSLIIFGYSSDVTRDIMCLCNENSCISSLEKDILCFISKNLKKLDYIETIDYLDMLDSLNNKTVVYYLEQLDNIEFLCDIKNEKKYIRDKKEFKTLIEGNEYKIKALSLLKKEKKD